MAVYHVLLKGSGIRATFGGTEIPCGFFKNEIVWASDPEAAIEKARRSVKSALGLNSAVNKDLSGLTLEVEEVTGGIGIRHLFQRQGFVFHRLDAEDAGN
jgi:hypothetical protein